MKKITEEEKEEAKDELDEAKSHADNAYAILHRHGFSDKKMDHLASLCCEVDEAIAEVDEIDKET